MVPKSYKGSPSTNFAKRFDTPYKPAQRLSQTDATNNNPHLGYQEACEDEVNANVAAEKMLSEIRRQRKTQAAVWSTESGKVNGKRVSLVRFIWPLRQS